MMKQKFSLLLALLMLLPAAACSENAAETNANDASETVSQSTEQFTDEETAETEAEAQNTLEALLPSADYEGREFRISCNSKYSSEMSVDELNGDVCNDAVYERNLKIEDLYNTKIVPVITTFVNNETHVNEVINTITAGSDEYELTAVYTYLAGRAVLEGCYHSWNNVPTVDFSREWWVQSANEAFSIAGERYVAVGDLSITTLLLSYAVFFNQQLAEDYALPDLYETVMNGAWTIDTLCTLTQDIYIDTDGNGAVGKGDLFGLGVEKVTNLDVYPSAFDISLISTDADGLPVIDIDVERMTTAVEKVYKLYYGNGNGTMVFDAAGDEIPQFAEGNLVFLTTCINNAFTTFREMEDDYGILPYPKLNEEQQNYYSNSMDNYSLLSVPVTVTDLDFVGLITEALTIESHNSVVPAYYDVALTEKYARDQNSVEMLDIIMAGRKYDFSILHSSNLNKLPYMFRNLIASQSTDFASTYAKTQKAMQKGLDKLIESYVELAARGM
ncbi:MAG: hypothetical protein ACI4V1_03270 [Eubacteriales bacterium]